MSTPHADPLASQHRTVRVRTVVIAALVLVLVAALVAIIVTTTSKMTMRGTITGVKHRTIASADDVCGLNATTAKRVLTQDARSPIGAGSTVTVFNSLGVPVASGQLDDGQPTSDSHCLYSFVVEDIPTGEDQYGITIGRLEMMYLSAEAAREPRLCILDSGGRCL